MSRARKPQGAYVPRLPADPAARAAALAPGFEIACYGEVAGVRVVALDAPSRPGRVEIAIRTRGANPQSIAVSPANAGRLLQALCLACVDLGLADQLIKEILESEERPSGATTH